MFDNDQGRRGASEAWYKYGQKIIGGSDPPALPDSYEQFIMNYHMNKIDTTLPELLNILETAEGILKSQGA